MGGVQAIAAAMTRLIADQGGEVVQNAEVDEVLVQDGRTSGIRLLSGDTIPADLVVSNVDAGHTCDRLMHNQPRKRWTPKKLAKARWSMGLFVWYFGTKGTRNLWKGAGQHTILVGPRNKSHIRDIFQTGHLSDDMSLYVNRPSVTDPGCAPEGDDTFYAQSPVPHLGHGETVDWATEAEP